MSTRIRFRSTLFEKRIELYIVINHQFFNKKFSETKTISKTFKEKSKQIHWGYTECGKLTMCGIMRGKASVFCLGGVRGVQITGVQQMKSKFH